MNPDETRANSEDLRRARLAASLRENLKHPDETRAKSEDLRRARLAASLRENLKRRKAQARARDAGAQSSAGPAGRAQGERGS